MAPLPPLAAGSCVGAMGAPSGKCRSATVDVPNVGAVSAAGCAATGSAFVTMSKLRLWAAALILTASVSGASKSPAKASVRVAAPPDTPETPAMERPGIAVRSSKLAAATPLPNAALCICTSTAAPFRPFSASGAVLDSAARTMFTATDRLRRSEPARFVSESRAWNTAVPPAVPVGVPHTVRGAVAQEAAVPGGKSAAAQPSASAPVASNFRPAGRFAAV